jgi:hypothetical protein
MSRERRAGARREPVEVGSARESDGVPFVTATNPDAVHDDDKNRPGNTRKRRVGSKSRQHEAV